MSTKVYTGFVVDTTDLCEVKRIVDGFKPWIAEQQLKIFDKFAAFENEMRDRELGHPDYWQGIAWAWREERNEIRRTGCRNVLADTDFSICIFPRPDQFYGMAFTEHMAWYEEWLLQPKVSEYSYWNSTDRPDGMKERDWENRRHVWSELLPGAGIPAQQGFEIKIGDPLGPDIYSHPAFQKQETQQ